MITFVKELVMVGPVACLSVVKFLLGIEFGFLSIALICRVICGLFIW